MSSTTEPGPKELCAYFVEVREQDGSYTVPTDYSLLVCECIKDKIFSGCSGDHDHIAICRSDNVSSLSFVPSNWESLRMAHSVLDATHSDLDLSGGGGNNNPIACLSEIIKAMDTEIQIRSYSSREVFFFATLSSCVLDLNEVTTIAEKFLQENIFLSIVLPNKESMSEIQRQNLQILREVFTQEKYVDVSFVRNLRKAQKQILNSPPKMLSYTNSRSWDVDFEISPNLKIPISGFVCTRETSFLKDMTRVLIKPGNQTGDETASAAENTDVSEAKKVIRREKFLVRKDGQRVEKGTMTGEAYYLADKLVQHKLKTETEAEEKCLNLLTFFPWKEMPFALLAGNGTTIFYPQKNNQKAEIEFNALLEAMSVLQHAAIVRKVLRKNSSCILGILYPDKVRGRLVQSALCFADDHSILPFPSLVKAKEAEGGAGSQTLSLKEELIDKLISGMTLDNRFTPFSGPVNPATINLRDQIMSKVLKCVSKKSKYGMIDTIDVCFKKTGLDSNLINHLKETFPLKENEDHERPAGCNIFYKRSLHTRESQDEGGKRLRLNEAVKPSAGESKGGSFDDLLDEL